MQGDCWGLYRGKKNTMRNRTGNSTSVDKRYIVRRYFFWFFILSILPLLGLAVSPDSPKQEIIPCRWQGVGKIVAVADIHGDYNHFVEILRGTELIDADMSWIGGKTHLVQMGDVVDRGPDAKKVFDLLMKLEVEAERDGGRVHQLIGNHEESNIIGIAFSQVGFISVEQFLSFLPEGYVKKREKKIRTQYGASNSPDETELERVLADFWGRVMKHEEKAQRLYIDTFNTNYGDWLLTKNAVVQINDIIFVHGGLSVEYSSWEIEDINRLLRKELTTVRNLLRHSSLQEIPFVPEMIYNNQGPLWYRGLAINDEKDFKEEVDLILSNLKSNIIVVGHTVQAGPINKPKDLSRFDGRVWTIDTGISDFYGGKQTALIIDEGKFNIWGISDAR